MMETSNNKLSAFTLLKLIVYLLSQQSLEFKTLSTSSADSQSNKNKIKASGNASENKIVEISEQKENINEHISMKPMSNLLYILKLKGLIKVDIHFSDGRDTREDVNLVSVNNDFAEIFDVVTEENLIIPIDQITAIRTKSGSMPYIPENALIPLKAKENGYSEFLLIDFFKNNIGSKIAIQTSENLCLDEEVTGVGEGIAVFNNNFAVAIPKIKTIKIVPKL